MCGVDVGGCVGVYPDRNDLKLGTVVVLDTVSKQTDFEFKGAWDRVRVTALGVGADLHLQ